MGGREPQIACHCRFFRRVAFLGHARVHGARRKGRGAGDGRENGRESGGVCAEKTLAEESGGAQGVGDGDARIGADKFLPSPKVSDRM